MVVTINGWGIYNDRRSNTSKGWGFSKKGAPPPPPPSHTSYCHIGQGRDLPLPTRSTPWFAPNLNNPGRRPTVYHIHTQQGQQNREKANSIPYPHSTRPTEQGEGQQYTISTLNKANRTGRRPTVYHIHTQQGQQNREKANSIGRRPTV